MYNVYCNVQPSQLTLLKASPHLLVSVYLEVKDGVLVRVSTQHHPEVFTAGRQHKLVCRVQSSPAGNCDIWISFLKRRNKHSDVSHTMNKYRDTHTMVKKYINYFRYIYIEQVHTIIKYTEIRQIRQLSNFVLNVINANYFRFHRQKIWLKPDLH